ncbi:beta-galactosidase-like [Amblyomma americanum]
MARIWPFLIGLVGPLLPVNDASRLRSFTVDYRNNRFLKDGKPFRFISGSLHYFRILKPYWKDRMQKMRKAGLNAVEIYVEWSAHEVEPGKFDFKGGANLKAFLDTAKKVGLLVIFRPGPYICAERDNGGLPYWLLRLNPNMKYRSSDPSYISRVDKWFDVLFPMVKGYLYKNGGPIIMVQVENEYGQLGVCDKAYMEHLVNITQHHFGRDVVLFRTDLVREDYYQCDHVPGTLVAADFGSRDNVDAMFKIVRKAMTQGPLVVAEYYSGWFDNWGTKHSRIDPNLVAITLDRALQYNASVNFYMFHGGTNFAFTNGANPRPHPTSYDYAAPLTEAGDPTDAYFKIREVVGRYLPLPRGPLPVPEPKLKIGPVHLVSCASLDSMIASWRHQGHIKPVMSTSPKTFEELSHAYGYVLYTAKVPFWPHSPAVLLVPGVKNRGYVFTKQSRAVLSTDRGVYNVSIVVQPGEDIKVLVENTGRINYGLANHDPKGITKPAYLDGRALTHWTMEPLPLNNARAVKRLAAALRTSKAEKPCSAPGTFYGSFTLPKWPDIKDCSSVFDDVIGSSSDGSNSTKGAFSARAGKHTVADTFLDMTGWGKGVVFINGFNLGRYWPSMGPQVTLYVPGVLLRPHPRKNEILIFETESLPIGNLTVNFVDRPILDSPVPGD